MVYAPIATLVLRDLVFSNLSWGNLSTSRLWGVAIDSEYPDRESEKTQVCFHKLTGGGNPVDMGADDDITTVECRVFMRPNTNKPATVNSYRTDREHLVEEIKRVVRQNRTNASGYYRIHIPRGAEVNLDVLNDPDVDPPIFETAIRINLFKFREELT